MTIYNQHAFPCEQHNGMTLRDYFAAKAMQAMISNETYMANIGKKFKETEDGLQEIANGSYKIADAMLKERSKP